MNRLLWKFQCGDFNVNIKKEGYGCKNLLSSTVDGCMPNETLEKCFSDKLYASIKSVNCGVSMRQASGDGPRKGYYKCKEQCYFRSSYYVPEAEKSFVCKRNLVEWRIKR